MGNTNFTTAGPIGAGLLLTNAVPQFRPGSVLGGNQDSVWVYCQAAGAIANGGQIGIIDEAFTFTPLDNTNGAAGFGQPVGVAPVAATANDYVWVQVNGTASVQVGANCAANVPLATTTTAGQIDDSVLTPTVNLSGIVLTTARGGTDGTAPAMLTRPSIATVN